MRRYITRIIFVFITAVILSGCISETETLPTLTLIPPSSTPNPPTSTPKPSSTPTSSPSPFPTPTVTPETYIGDHPDGSRSYFDTSFGYKITFPPKWVIIELTGDDVDEILSAAAEELPALHDAIELTALYSQGFSVVAYNVEPDFFVSGNFPNVNVLILESSLSLDFILRTNVQMLEQFFPGSEVHTSEIITNSKGVPLGIVAYTLVITSEDGTSVSTFAKAAAFKNDDWIITITGTGGEDLRVELEPIFDDIFDTIELIDS